MNLSLKDSLISFVTFCWSNSTGRHTAESALKFDVASDPKILTSILKITGPIGLTLMAVYFMIGLFRDMSNEKDTDVHIFVRNGITMLVADIALMKSPEIVGHLMSLSNSFMNQMNTAVVEAGENVSNVMSMSFDGLSIVALVFLAILSFFAYIVGLVGAAIVFIVCASAKIELMIRFSYAPIGLATIAEGGPRMHEAFRYLKKLLASSFYFGAIILALYLANSFGKGLFISPTIEDGNYMAAFIACFVNALYTVVLPLAAVGSIGVAKQIINEAFGT